MAFQADLSSQDNVHQELPNLLPKLRAQVSTLDAEFYRPGELLKMYLQAPDRALDSPLLEEVESKPVGIILDTVSLDLFVPPPGLDAPPPGLVAPPPGLVAPPPGLVAPPPGLGECQSEDSEGENRDHELKHTLELHHLLAAIDNRSGLPSVGSAGHHAGTCKPCGFFHTRGCTDGAACSFCHICPHGTIERQRKEKRHLVRALQRKQRSQGQTSHTAIQAHAASVF
mmetsp:Transcript_47781/g.89525  ORF Transcript_47781/g.89525 Transcript_47781/m.89525 type:complete len:227 (+) Transcript_47781:59-739(+)